MCWGDKAIIFQILSHFKILKVIVQSRFTDVPAESTKIDNCELICNSDLKHHLRSHVIPADKQQEETQTNSFKNHVLIFGELSLALHDM